MTIPDITAYRLDRAVDMLEKTGVKYYLKNITSPIDIKKDNIPDHFFKVYRVLRQEEVGNNLLALTIAEEQKSEFSV